MHHSSGCVPERNGSKTTCGHVDVALKPDSTHSFLKTSPGGIVESLLGSMLEAGKMSRINLRASLAEKFDDGILIKDDVEEREE